MVFDNLLLILFIVIFLPIIGIPWLLFSARFLGSKSGLLAMLFPLASLILVIWLSIQAGPEPQRVWTIPWIPSLGVQFSFLLDGLSLFFAFIICGIGVWVCWYATAYLGKGYAYGRFYTTLLLFMSAMLGTVFSDNFFLMFIFWEVTGVASFLLIGYFHDNEASRIGARQSLIVTMATGLFLLAGLILLQIFTGMHSFSDLYMHLPIKGLDAKLGNAICILLLIGAFGKSAQFPFYFWLPNAMAAPTPVSAYLHSATMVKLGIFLVARFFPVFHSLDLWIWLACGIGFFTMVYGAWLALQSHDLKSILAYTTISQLGLLIGAYGLGSKTGNQADFVHIVSHALYKGSLFMGAGIIEHCTGTRDIRRLGGLVRALPVTAFSVAVAAGALAGIPFTTGFLSKEILLSDLASVGSWFIFSAVILSAILNVAIAIRLFYNVFFGEPPSDQPLHHAGGFIQIPPLILSLTALILGTFPFILEAFVNRFKVASLHTSEPLQLAIWHGFHVEFFATLLAFFLGIALYAWLEKSGWQLEIPSWLRFDRFFELGLEALGAFSKRLTLALQADWPPAYLPILIGFLLLTLLGTIATSYDRLFEGFAHISYSAHPLRVSIAILIVSCLLGVLFLSRWSSQLIALGSGGFFLTIYFVFYKAPDLAMTQILVDSASVIMILFLLSHFPSSQLLVQIKKKQPLRHAMQIVLSTGVGLAMFLLVLFAELHRHPQPIGIHLLQLSKPLAEGTNAVNTILVDFRAFDTLGEITVLFIATLGALGLMMRYKRRRGEDPSPPPGFYLEKARKP